MTTKQLCVKIMKQFIGIEKNELTTLELNILKLVEKQADFTMCVTKYGQLVLPDEDPL
jgi:hypothetical protein